MAKDVGTEPQAQDEAADLITLEDENGHECTFEVIDATDVDGVHYLAVVPTPEQDQQETTESVLILMRVGKDEKGEFMDIVEDDEELYQVSRVFEQRLRDKYHITDEELHS